MSFNVFNKVFLCQFILHSIFCSLHLPFHDPSIPLTQTPMTLLSLTHNTSFTSYDGGYRWQGWSRVLLGTPLPLLNTPL